MSDAAAASQSTWRPRANPWAIAVAVTLAAFMEVLDTTIVNVSLPHIAGSMSASYDDATWTLTSYLVANGIVLTISGWLSGLLGRKRYFLICITMFTVMSLLCGLSQNLAELIVFRLLQGFFGGGLQPSQQSIILDTFPPSQRGRAFGVTAIATVVAPVLGPTLGGLITDHFSWRWIFFINVPVGLITLFAVLSLVEDPPWAAKLRRKIDYIGLSLITIGLGSMQILLDRGEDADWFGSGLIQLMAVLAFVGIAGAIAWLLYARNPVVNLMVFANRNFAVGSLCMFLMAAILYSSAVVVPRLAQQQLGYTATLAGYLLSPGAIALVFVIPIVGRVMPLVQTRFVVAFGFVCLGCALLYSHGLTPDIDYRTLVLMRVTQSVSLAFLFVPISTLAYSTMSRMLNNDAAAMFTMIRNIGGSIGISVASALLTSRAQVHQAYLSQNLTPLNPAYNNLVQTLHQGLQAHGSAAAQHGGSQGIIMTTLINQSAFGAYMDVFSICAVVAFCAVPLTLLFSTVKSGMGGAGH